MTHLTVFHFNEDRADDAAKLNMSGVTDMLDNPLIEKPGWYWEAANESDLSPFEGPYGPYETGHEARLAARDCFPFATFD